MFFSLFSSSDCFFCLDIKFGYKHHKVTPRCVKPKPCWRPCQKQEGCAHHRLGTLSCARLPEMLAQVEISFLNRLFLTWMGFLIQFTPWTHLSCHKELGGQGRTTALSWHHQSINEIVTQTVEQLKEEVSEQRGCKSRCWYPEPFSLQQPSAVLLDGLLQSSHPYQERFETSGVPCWLCAGPG